MRNALLLAITLVAGSLCNSANAQMTKLRVEVKNMDGKPVDNGSVLVRFVEGRSAVKLGKKIKTSWEIKTNQEGAVSIPPIPQGKILVQVMAKGYQTFGQTIDVTEEEKTIQVQLKPPQSQYSAHQ
jgi:uncharacterized GH25 family protein